MFFMASLAPAAIVPPTTGIQRILKVKILHLLTYSLILIISLLKEILKD